MEARLKEDILSEVRCSGGRMLLHREECSPALNQSSVIGYWENILADDVKTPAEVYAALKDEGYNITYRRIPLTREREALASDVDAIQYCKDEYVSLPYMCAIRNITINDTNSSNKFCCSLLHHSLIDG